MKKKTRLAVVFILTIIIVILSIRLNRIKQQEVTDISLFTDYFQENASENGGLELLTENFTTIKKEYTFIRVKEEPKIEKKVNIIEYTVVAGDTLEKIAKQNNVTVDTLKINSQAAREGKLKAGSKIYFPSEEGLMYKIKKGDTLGKIAKYYGIKTSEIVEKNKINPKKLNQGETIFLPSVTLKKIQNIEEEARKKEEKLKAEKKAREQRKAEAAKTSSEKTKENIPTSKGGFAYPVKYSGISSPFGNRFHPVLKRYILHTGVDLVAKYIPVRASKEGVVSFAGYMNGYGKIIIIKHANNFETRYAHLSVISTKVGEKVNKGELIGKSGNSGRSTGPHLHFEIRKNGVPQNPMKYL